MALKLACCFGAIEFFEKAAVPHTWAAPPRFVGPPSPATFHPRDMSNAPVTSLSPKLLRDAMAGGVGTSASGRLYNLGVGACTIAQTSDQAQWLSRLTGVGPW